MLNVIDSLTQRPIFTLGLGAFLGGVVLLYLVMQRSRRHRIRRAEENHT